jgi:hypothetical protein
LKFETQRKIVVVQVEREREREKNNYFLRELSWRATRAHRKIIDKG